MAEVYGALMPLAENNWIKSLYLIPVGFHSMSFKFTRAAKPCLPLRPEQRWSCRKCPNHMLDYGRDVRRFVHSSFVGLGRKRYSGGWQFGFLPRGYVSLH